MADWRTLSFQGYTVIERVAAVFQVGPPLPDPLPFASFTVKVFERNDGSFAAHLNVAVRRPDGPRTTRPEGVAHPTRPWRTCSRIEAEKQCFGFSHSFSRLTLCIY